MKLRKNKNTNPCLACSLCCKYVSLEIDKPKLKVQKDIDEIRWFLLHENVEIYIDNENNWNIQFNTKCKKLNKNGLCSIYKNRPKICRQHSVKECEKYGKDAPYKISFKNINQFEKWLSSKKIKR
jgi:Fe-S-cluster containining protein